MNLREKLSVLFILIFLSACNLPVASPPQDVPSAAVPDADAPTQPIEPTLAPSLPQEDATAVPPPGVEEPQGVVHLVSPGITSEFGILNYDVESSGTGPQKRAPFGDSYRLNLLERPFDQEMNYLPDLDIRTFSLVPNDIWYYLTIQLIGSNPNNELGIRYGVVLDLDRDGYGDFLLLATPPYTEDWTATNVQIYADRNRNSAGISPTRSDAPFDGDGYETLIFDLNQGIGDDTDLAWVRLERANVIQFAFKREWVGAQFMFGVLADAGLQDPARMDYVDALTEAQAGSPVRENQFYPVKELYSVDTTCNAAFGFAATGYEPKICPRIIPAGQATSVSGDPDPEATPPTMTGCPTPTGGSCPGDAPFWWAFPHCACSSQPFYEP